MCVCVCAAESEAEPIPQVVLTSVVLFCFLSELTLRQIAKGMRFWKDVWNLFDFVVVWVSIAMVLAKVCPTASSISCAYRHAFVLAHTR